MLRRPLKTILCICLFAGSACLNASANDLETVIRAGNSAYEAGDFDKAQSLYSNVLAADPWHAVALNNRGLSYERMGRLEAAARDLTQALERHPENGTIWNNRANVNCALKRVGRSVFDRMQALYTGRFTAAQAQTGLRRSGFYRGPSDGIWGYDSEDALEDWTRAGCPRAPGSRLI